MPWPHRCDLLANRCRSFRYATVRLCAGSPEPDRAIFCPDDGRERAGFWQQWCSWNWSTARWSELRRGQCVRAIRPSPSRPFLQTRCTAVRSRRPVKHDEFRPGHLVGEATAHSIVRRQRLMPSPFLAMKNTLVRIDHLIGAGKVRAGNKTRCGRNRNRRGLWQHKRAAWIRIRYYRRHGGLYLRRRSGHK